MPEAPPSPDAPPSQAAAVNPVPLEPPDAGSEGGASLGALCLHCKQNPATKAEHDDGFTLCDACYFQALPDVPPRSAQDRLIAVQTAEILRLTRELEAARNALVGGS